MNDVWEESGVWWHRDETDDVCGPFANEPDALEALANYCLWLELGDPTGEGADRYLELRVRGNDREAQILLGRPN